MTDPSTNRLRHTRSPHMRIISIFVTALLLLAAAPSPAQEKEPLVTRDTWWHRNRCRNE